MVTTDSPSPSPDHVQADPTQKGFFGQLVNSVFEPGANHAAVLAMNVSFFLLLLVLFALAFLTSWNKHVLLLLVVSTLLWVSMIWFVMEITRLQSRPDNMPILDGRTDADVTTSDGGVETKKQR